MVRRPQGLNGGLAGRIQPIGGLRSAPSSQVGPPRGENSTHRATPESRKTGKDAGERGDQRDPIFANRSSGTHFSPRVEASSPSTFCSAATDASSVTTAGTSELLA